MYQQPFCGVLRTNLDSWVNHSGDLRCGYLVKCVVRLRGGICGGKSLDCDDDDGKDESSRKDRDDGIVIYIESKAGHGA